MKDKSIASVKHLRNCDRNFFALSTVRGAVVYLRGCFKSRILCLFNTLTGDCKSRLQRQNPPARVVNCLVHEGGLRLCSSGFNRRILLKHPLSHQKTILFFHTYQRYIQPKH